MHYKLKYIPPIDRPREKLGIRGPSSLSDRELIAIIVGNGTKKKDALQVAGELARRMQHDFDILKNRDLLQKIEGIGPVKAAQINAAFELSKRHLITEKKTISSPQEALPLVDEFRYKKREYFISITVNGGFGVIKKRVISIGTINQSLIHPREVFAGAVTDRAYGVFLVHNHPSGDDRPSREDVAVTKRLVRAGEILGIEIIDHLVLGKTGYFSFKEDGLL
jgi:DNA repair protein RadC